MTLKKLDARNLNSRSPSSAHLQMVQRAQLMAGLVKRLFSYYHSQALADDPEIFLTKVTEVFAESDCSEDQAKRVVDKLAKEFKFPPRISEIYSAIEEVMAPVRRQQVRDARPLLLRDERPKVDLSEKFKKLQEELRGNAVRG